MRRALERLPFERPLVVLSVLVDSDLDRAALGFRDWPKPLVDFDSNGEVVVEPVAASAAEHLEGDPLGISSYAYRYLLHGARVLPESWRAKLMGQVESVAEIQRRSREIFAASKAELEAQGARYFVLVFNGRESFEQGDAHSWREPFLRELLAELEMPFVSTRVDLAADAKESGSHWRDYFIWDTPARGHYNPRGNGVALRAIERGFRGEFEAP